MVKISEKSIDHAVNAFYNGGGVRLYPDGAGTGIGVIDAALSVASKRKTGQRGRPDFIGIFNRDSETLLVIESKADPANHISPGLRGQGAYVKNDFLKGKEVATNACDGALHYAKILSPHYNVIALGVSGLSTDGNIASSDYYYQLRGSDTFVHIQSDGRLWSPGELLREIRSRKEVIRYRVGELSRRAHGYVGTLTELGVGIWDRAMFIGAILVALEDKDFSEEILREDDVRYLLSQMRQRVLDRSASNREQMRLSLKLLETNILEAIGSNKTKANKLRQLITSVSNLRVTAGVSAATDDLGAFYTAFMSKSANATEDQQRLGIVLTPHHITEIFPMIAPPSNNDTVFVDTCCGTAGFLVSALRALENQNGGRPRNFVNKNLWGVERDGHMYPLACLNMIMKGGDAGNILQGDAFEGDIKRAIGRRPPSIAYLNPPYTLRKPDRTLDYSRHELAFVINACDIVQKGGKVVALIPVKSVAASDNTVNQIKADLMKVAAVDAVFKMSKVTFEGIANVETIIIVCTPGTPHPPKKAVYFGNWEEDGMVFARRMGAVDKNETHDKKIEQFVDHFKRQVEVEGESIFAAITPDDEWLYQTKLPQKIAADQLKKRPSKENIARYVLNYLASQIRLGEVDILSATKRQCVAALKTPSAPRRDWRLFRLSDALRLTKGKRYDPNMTAINFKEYPEPGFIPYVSSSDLEEKQGLNGYISRDDISPTHSGSYMTINYGGGALNCFYREGPAYCTDSLNVATIAGGPAMDVFIASFLKEMINRYKPCFSYNLQPSLARIRHLQIALPIDKNDKVDWDYVRAYAMKSYCKFFAKG